MNCYWSCWFSRAELEADGACGLISAKYRHTESSKGPRLVPTPELYTDGCHSFAFCADETFITFLKLKYRRSIVEVPAQVYDGLSTGKEAALGDVLGRKVFFCDIDF